MNAGAQMMPAQSARTLRGAAAWGLALSRDIRAQSERPDLPRELAQVTLRYAAYNCSAVAARMLLDGNTVLARTYAEAMDVLEARADRADRARVDRLAVAA